MGLPAWDAGTMLPPNDVNPCTGDADGVADAFPDPLPADTGTLVLVYKGITGPELGGKAGFGMRKANWPSVAGTSWKPP